MLLSTPYEDETNSPLLTEMSPVNSTSPNTSHSSPPHQTNPASTGYLEACRHGHTNTVSILLKDPRIDVNTQDQNGNTGFLLACSNGYPDLVSLLLKDSRVKLNQGDNYGQTGLIQASQRGHTQIVSLLLGDSRVAVNKADNGGSTAFIWACSKGHTEIVSLFLADYRIDVRKTDKGRSTGFIWACANGHREIVSLLMQDPRIDINKENISGRTGYVEACANGHSDIVSLLISDPRVNLQKDDSSELDSTVDGTLYTTRQGRGNTGTDGTSFHPTASEEEEDDDDDDDDEEEEEEERMSERRRNPSMRFQSVLTQNSHSSSQTDRTVAQHDDVLYNRRKKKTSLSVRFLSICFTITVCIVILFFMILTILSAVITLPLLFSGNIRTLASRVTVNKQFVIQAYDAPIPLDIYGQTSPRTTVQSAAAVSLSALSTPLPQTTPTLFSRFTGFFSWLVSLMSLHIPSSSPNSSVSVSAPHTPTFSHSEIPVSLTS